jgi:hypothetical protein
MRLPRRTGVGALAPAGDQMVFEPPNAPSQVASGFLVAFQGGDFFDQSALGQGEFFEAAIKSVGHHIDAFVEALTLGGHTQD